MKLTLMLCIGNYKCISIGNRNFVIDIYQDSDRRLYYNVAEILKNRPYPYHCEDYGDYKNPRASMRKIRNIVEK